MALVAMGAVMQRGLCKQDDVGQQHRTNQESRSSLLACESWRLSVQEAPPSSSSSLAFCGCGLEERSCICLIWLDLKSLNCWCEAIIYRLWERLYVKVLGLILWCNECSEQKIISEHTTLKQLDYTSCRLYWASCLLAKNTNLRPHWTQAH